MAKRQTPTRTIGRSAGKALRGLFSLSGYRSAGRLSAYAAEALMGEDVVVTPKGSLKFWSATAPSSKRATGFLADEPDTRDWIDRHIKPDQHLWDVGANVGAYTLYASLTPGVTVTAFEPVAGTFAILARNVAINGLGARVTPLCAALSESTGIVPLHLTSLEGGAAMHALGEPENVAGSFPAAAVQPAMTLRGEDVPALLSLAAPHHMKIDVDGHELRVLQGMGALLGRVGTVWIEMFDQARNAAGNAQIEACLAAHGFEAAPSTSAKGRNRLFVNRTPAA